MIYWDNFKSVFRNIFLHNGHAKIGDLGLASMFDSKYMFTLAGTYFYMSPEMITSSGYDCKTDVWYIYQKNFTK